MKRNLLKAKLNEGKVAIGAIIQDPAPQIVEILGLLGFDWLFIDCEHSALTLQEVSRLIMAAELRNITPLVRVPQNLPEVILQYLDIGAMGILIPGLETAEDAEKAVQGAKYPPQGLRGLAGARCADFGLVMSLGEYVRGANEEIMVLGVMESVTGVENVERILETKGIDGVSIGTNDLSQSLGVPGQTNHPLVVGAVNRVLAAGRKCGKPVGGLVRGGETPKQYIDQGYRMVLTSVYGLLVGAGRQFLNSARG